LRKIFLIFFIVINLFASAFEVEKKIYTIILSVIFPQQQKIKIWSDDKKSKKLFQNLPLNIKLVRNKNQADILFIFHTFGIKTNKKVFVGRYRLLKEYKNQAIGGFYWQKGRPNLIFLHKNIDFFNIKLPSDMKEFEEDEI